MLQKTKRTPQAFTLVELIVVVTILAILATIGFVSYSSYLTGVRDTNRLSQLVSIHDGLALYSTKKDLPIPDDSVEVKVTVASTDYLVAYQGYAGSNTLETIDFTKGGKDPKDDEYFSYMLTKDRKHLQIMAWLEEEENLSASISSSYAADYDNRIPTVYGKNLGILTDATNGPIQEATGVDGEVVFDGTGTEYTAYLSDTNQLTSSGANIMYGAYVEIAGRSNKTCKEILSKHPYVTGTDGVYWINIASQTIKTDCDMTIEGGGWTRVIHGNGADIAKYHAGYPTSRWNDGNIFIPPTSATSSMKMSDSAIASIQGSEPFLVKGEHQSITGTSIYYVPGTCIYEHEEGSVPLDNNPCGDMYPNINLTSQFGCIPGTDKGGIGCYPPAGTDGITFNFKNSNGPICLQTGGNGGCNSGTFGETVSLGLYVR